MTTRDEAYTDLLTILPGCTPAEITEVRRWLRAGALSGATCTRCFFGIVAGMRQIDYMTLHEAGIASPTRPFEEWLFVVRQGHTPETTDAAEALDTWLTAWLDSHP